MQESDYKKVIAPEGSNAGNLVVRLEREKFKWPKFKKHLRHPCAMEGASGYCY